jgi:hypothetical protein
MESAFTLEPFLRQQVWRHPQKLSLPDKEEKRNATRTHTSKCTLLMCDNETHHLIIDALLLHFESNGDFHSHLRKCESESGSVYTVYHFLRGKRPVTSPYFDKNEKEKLGLLTPFSLTR